MKTDFLSKQNSPRWDAAFCGVTSGAMLFVYVILCPIKGTPGINELKVMPELIPIVLE